MENHAVMPENTAKYCTKYTWETTEVWAVFSLAKEYTV